MSALTTHHDGPPVVVVTGTGAARHVRTAARRGDVTLDLDTLCDVLGGADQPHVRLVALVALSSGLERAKRLRDTGVRVWLVHPHPTPEQLAAYRAAGHAVESS
ncbi:hypothetical protein Cch01nite_24910 [Cellulomonas chitinilytica]|uniref:Uncharacterized protein n=1 Tax=Cellulomonas chitinilytica TaxID=398759 RepID=A0A919P416_9CELL|nr:hypothetical protein [Cellulomonas chitinilytica]GIG21767.1 hypothetical protein Cch01nite_24910 [Cellulomonas chitinilytica]